MLTHEERMALWKERKLSLTALASALDVTPGHILRVLNGERRSPAVVEPAIARWLRMPVEGCFPPQPASPVEEGVA